MFIHEGYMAFHPSIGGLHITLKPLNSRPCLVTSFELISYHKYLQCSCTSATSSNQQPLGTHLVHNLREKSCSCFWRGWNTEMYRFCLDCSCQWHYSSQNWFASISYRATVVEVQWAAHLDLHGSSVAQHWQAGEYAHCHKSSKYKLWW